MQQGNGVLALRRARSRQFFAAVKAQNNPSVGLRRQLPLHKGAKNNGIMDNSSCHPERSRRAKSREQGDALRHYEPWQVTDLKGNSHVVIAPQNGKFGIFQLCLAGAKFPHTNIGRCLKTKNRRGNSSVLLSLAKIIQLLFRLRGKRKPVSYLCPIFRI